jgi:hypothetical protein
MRNREQKAQRHMQAKQRKTIRRRQRRGPRERQNTSHERLLRITPQFAVIAEQRRRRQNAPLRAPPDDVLALLTGGCG